MIDSYLDQLQSPDVEERRAAIVALAKAKDPAALPALGRLYKEDPIPELRELALKAGRYIKQAQNPTVGEVPPPPRTASQLRSLPLRADSQSGDVPPRTGSQTGAMPPRTPSKQEETRARSFLDTSLNYYSSGDRPRAVESLGRAFELNPMIYKEAVAANLAQTLTGLNHDEAIALMGDQYRRKAFAASLPGAEVVYGSGKAKRGGKAKSDKMVTWIDLLLDLALFWLVVSIALTAVFGIGVKTLVDEYGDQIIDASARNPSPYTQDDLDTLTDISVVFWLFISMTFAISWAISLMINGLAIHLAATMGMAGKNSYVDFMHRFIPFVTVLALLYGITSTITIVLIPDAPGIANLLWTLMGIGIIVSLFVLAWLIGNVYQFGIIYGFATMILSVIVSCILGCLFNFVFSALLGGGNSAIILLAR